MQRNAMQVEFRLISAAGSPRSQRRFNLFASFPSQLFITFLFSYRDSIAMSILSFHASSLQFSLIFLSLISDSRILIFSRRSRSIHLANLKFSNSSFHRHSYSHLSFRLHKTNKSLLLHLYTVTVYKIDF